MPSVPLPLNPALVMVIVALTLVRGACRRAHGGQWWLARCTCHRRPVVWRRAGSERVYALGRTMTSRRHVRRTAGPAPPPRSPTQYTHARTCTPLYSLSTELSWRQLSPRGGSRPKYLGGGADPSHSLLSPSFSLPLLFPPFPLRSRPP